MTDALNTTAPSSIDPPNAHPVTHASQHLHHLLLDRPSLTETARLVTALLHIPLGVTASIITDASTPTRPGVYLPAPPACTPLDITDRVHALARTAGQFHPDPFSVTSNTQVVAWPLASGSSLIGACMLATTAPALLRHHQPTVDACIATLALYLAGARRSDAHTGHATDLTTRQRTILEHMATGATLHRIAQELGFSESTIRAESMRIYRAFGVRGRADALAVARQHGLLESATSHGTEPAPREACLDEAGAR